MTHKDTHGGACTCHSCAPPDPETVALAAEPCYCAELDPRAVQGGHRCGSCEARDEVRRA